MSAPLRVWLQAARPRTLPAAVVPVVVGSAVVVPAGLHPAWGPFLGCLGGALLLQIGCNFANDAFDHLHGADTAARVGPQRAVAAGLISPRAMLAAAAGVLLLAVAVGLYLATIAGWPIFLLGLASVAAAVLYTGGPLPLAYIALGDLFVYAFFGLVAVIGTVDVQTLAHHRAANPWATMALLSHLPVLLALASAVGLQCTAILAVNNLRDIPTDRAVGKRTLAVVLGPRLTRGYYGLLHLGATCCLARVAFGPELHDHRWLAVPVVVAGVGGLLLTVLVARRDGPALNAMLARSAALELLTGALVVVGLTI